MQAPLSTTARFRLFFALNYAAIGIFFPYIALYLSSLELSGSQIGLLLGIIPLVGFLVQPLWGLLSDVYQVQKAALVLGCAGLAAAGVLYAMTTSFRHLLGITILLAVMRAPISPLSTALALEHLEREGRRTTFGTLRLWGSIGFALSSFGVGALVIDQHVWRILPLFGVLSLLLAIVALFLPDADLREAVRWRDGVTLLQRRPQLTRFLAGVLLIGATLGVVNNYLAVYLDEIAAPGWVIGAAMAIAALCEVPLMARVPELVGRWGLRLILVGGTSLLIVRYLSYALITEPLLVLPTQVLHSAAMTSLLVVGVLYVDRQLDRNWRASGQALYTASLHGIGPSIGLVGAGLLFDRGGSTLVWLASALVALAGTLILLTAIPKRRAQAVPQEVPG